MSDYIGRELLKNKIRAAFPSFEDRCRINGIVNSLPAADVKPVVYGKWVFIGDNMFECSNCCTPYTKEWLLSWKRFKNDSDFPNCCPNCGMICRGENNE